MSTRLLYVVSFFAFLLSQVFAQKLQTVTIQGREAVADEVIVKLKPQNAMAKASRTAARENLLRQCGASVKTAWMTGSELWKVQRQDLERVLELLKKNPLVDYAYPNYMSVKPAGSSGKIPNDPDFSNQWHLLNTGQGGGTVGADIRATEAWNITTGDSTIVVAILDSGVDTDHPDLKANVWKNKDELPGNGIDDDNNGFIDDVLGWDFIANDNAPLAHNYPHGTAGAGLIAAIQDNGIGISGVAPRVKIMVLRVVDSTGGPISAAVSAMEYAIKNGAKILNCSLAGGTLDPAQDEMLGLVNDHGLLVVAAAGNDHADLDGSSKSYPAQYNYPNIVVVANSDFRDNLSMTSNFGQNEVDVAAPGELVYTTTLGGKYFAYSGTSFSAPVVTGVAALVWSVFPTLTADQVRQQLILSSDLIPSLYTYSNSNGRVNAYKAVQGLYLSPLTLTTRSVNFGAAKLKTTSAAKSVWIKNWSDSPVNVDSLILGTAFSFSATDTTMKKSAGLSISARDSISVNVFFCPSTEGKTTGALSLYDANSSGRLVQLITVLEGTGVSTGTIINTTTVSGTWTKAASPYFVSNSIEVRERLVIEPGTVMKFESGCGVTVLSGATLLARGSATDSIVFTPLDPQKGWKGIKIEQSGSDDTLSYCIFERVKYARAVYLLETSAVVTHCTFRQNGTAVMMAGGEEGGIVVEGGPRGNPTITHCVFYDNGASNGGALALRSVDSAKISNLLCYNNAGIYGGAMYIQESNVVLSNITLYNNTAKWGGAIDLYAGGTVDLVNSIFWKNYAGARNPAISHTPQFELTAWASTSATTLRFKYCVIDTFPGWCKNDTSLTNLHKVEVASTNLYSDPTFIDVTKNDFRLGANSPAIDAGSPNYDISQEPFPHGYRINLGYDGGTAQATQSWQTKLVAAPDEVYLGGMKPDSTYTTDIYLRNGCATPITVTGFALSNSREFSLQNPPTLPFVIQSGQSTTLRLNVKAAAQLDSTYTCLFTATSAGGQSEVLLTAKVVYGTVITATEIAGVIAMSGSPYVVTQSVVVPSGNSLTIEPGVRLRFMKGTTLTVGQNARLLAIGSEQDSVYFTAAVPADGWSGIYIENSGDDDVFSYCVISGAIKPKSDQYAMSTALTIYSSSPIIKHITIRENSGGWNGTAIGIGGSSSPQLQDMLISNNSGSLSVGFFCGSSGVHVRNVRFTQNVVNDLNLVSARDNTFSNVLVDNNSISQGGIIRVEGQNTFNNLTVTRNLISRTMYGGGIFEPAYHFIKMIIRNSIIWNNSDGALGNGTILYSSCPTQSEAQIINSDIDTAGKSWLSVSDSRNTLPVVRWMGQNILADPKFTDALNCDFTLSSQSPCINAGTADTTGLSLPVSDLNGNYRIAGGRIDIGAYEWGSTEVPVTGIPATPEIKNTVPRDCSLEQNYPNPFNPSTTVRFGIPKTAFVTLKVFDVLGREIETLLAMELTPGFYESIWKPHAASGIYFYRLESGGFVETRKMILMK